MGSDISVFQENELEEDFWRHYGPKDESTLEFFSRVHRGLLNVILQPKRLEYTLKDCQHRSFVDHYNFSHYKLQGLQCVLWQRKNNFNTVIIYMHTNTRASIDALEILPCCDALEASLFSFDFRGCGKSEGVLHASMEADLSLIVNNIICTVKPLNIIIWARGMATTVAIDYVADHCHEEVKFVVLDTPFASVQRMVHDAAANMNVNGLHLPSPLVSLCTSMICRNIQSSLGVDPYGIAPINRVASIDVPAHVVAAANDDYIPMPQCIDIAQNWSGMCSLHTFEGRHFGTREASLIQSVADRIRPYIYIPDADIDHIAREVSDDCCDAPASISIDSMMKPICRVKSTSALSLRGLTL